MTVQEPMPKSAEVTTDPPVPGEGFPRRHPETSGGKFVERLDESISTLYDSITTASKRYGERHAMGSRIIDSNGAAGPYEFITFGMLETSVRDLAAGLATLDLAPQSMVGIYAANCPEWHMAQYAGYYLNLCIVPMYDTLGKDNLCHIANETDLSLIFVSKALVPKLIDLVDHMKSLKTIVCFDDVAPELVKKADNSSKRLLSFDQLKQLGSPEQLVPRPPTAEDLCLICYTSGTSGNVKGVMHTHASLMSAMSAVLYLGRVTDPESGNTYLPLLDHNDVHLSYLPLAHVFEFACSNAMLMVGACIGYFQGDVLKLLDDMAALKPTFLIAVPRLLTRIHSRIVETLNSSSWIKRKVFDFSFSWKMANLKGHQSLTSPLLDTLLFSKFRAKLGGRVKAILSGSAPLSSEILDFVAVCFGVPVFQAYGLTECGSTAAITTPFDWSSGSVGIPFPCCEIKLVDVPEMDYTSQDKPYPRGEVSIRGPNVMKGYFNNPEGTAEVLRNDGWLLTGDIGKWDDDGRLSIIDRKKNIFKLSQGEYVAAEKVESALMSLPLIEQAFVDGDESQNFPMAVVVPNFDLLRKWAAEEGITDLSDESLSVDRHVKSHICAQILTLGKTGSNVLKGFEVPAKVYIEKEAFSIDNDLLTPTSKLRRTKARSHYKEIINKIYLQ